LLRSSSLFPRQRLDCLQSHHNRVMNSKTNLPRSSTVVILISLRLP
jgi:hypothetical protein